MSRTMRGSTSDAVHPVRPDASEGSPEGSWPLRPVVAEAPRSRRELRHLATLGDARAGRPEASQRLSSDHHATIVARTEGRAHSPFMVLLVLACTLGILLYGQFLLNPANRGDLLPYAAVIVAEAVLVVQALLSMWTILSGGQNPRDFDFHSTQDTLYDEAEIDRLGVRDQPHLWPIVVDGERKTVDVFITVYGEELSKIAMTVQAAIALQGEHRTWVLDDGRSDEVRDLAGTLGARYIRRLSSNGAKAGNVNHALTVAKGDYFAIFDADFVPRPMFLHETVPFFVDEKVAFVQTPQSYGNLVSLVSRGAGYMQAVFYRFIQPGRNRFNAAFCVGTNVIFRRAAVDDVGGIDTDSKSEDVWTSLFLHEAGWRSIYIPLTLAVGDAPETIEAYSKQQLRWATGGFEILFRHNPLSPRRNLTMDQRFQYMLTATHYLTGIAPLLLIMVPPMEIFFDLRPMNLHISVLQWLLFYSGFYLLQIALAFFTLGSFRWEVLMLASVSFPIYVKALWNVLSGKDTAWNVTGGKAASSPFNVIVPQVLFWVFLSLTSLVAIWRDWDNRVLTLATVWNLINTAVLSGFLLAALREARAIKRAARSGSSARTTVGAPIAAVTTVGQPTPELRTQVARPLPRSHEELLAMSDEAAAQARRDQDRRQLLEARLAVEDDQRDHGARQHDPSSAVGRSDFDARDLDAREKVDS
ncbi:glycosyltransferase family 2 protein [Frigoribacterium sp. ACAM 257]|uniref:glycosyltransferase family 2 protein n=1 Tax=Frigoribacterium sp. ACAM 257 TaxID=2508998 RepID=UPI001CB89C58|nr:glycosyltransferase family 2 protein [Frigoribacterium sp. ACAM 257]